jgi:hypothetical protein
MIKKFIHSAVLCSCQTIALVADPTPDCFMDALSGDQKLKDLSLLGAHDAGTYALYPSMGVSPDEYGNFIYTIGNTPIIGPLVDNTLIKAWSQTQQSDMTGQLNEGVRYFDLRFALDSNGDFRVCHGLFGSLLGDVLNQINAFLNDHPQEIVLLDLDFFDQQGNSLTEDQQNQVIGNIQQIFGNKIAPSVYGVDVTLGQMWQEQQQVIVFWHDSAMAMSHPDLLWDRTTFLLSTWYNQTDWNDLEQDLDQGLTSRPPEIFYVNQAVLTPDATMIITHLLSSLLSIEATTNVSAVDWYAQQAAAGSAGNILMLDNVDSAYSQVFQISMDYNLSK